MNPRVGCVQHPIRTVPRMEWLPHLFRSLGSAGATANARAELEATHLRNLQASILVRRVNRSSADLPLSSAAVARVA